MPKRKCVFNENLQRKYPFIKQRSNIPSDVRCEKCRTEFSVSHGGASDIEQHLRSDKHRRSEHASSSSTLMVDYFKKSDAPSSKDMDIAAAEGVWAYHTVHENHSFRSNDCASKLIQQCFEPKFRCARTKTESIVTNVLARNAVDDMKEQLIEAKCISILTDASNHGSQKIFPILVRYFRPYEGVQVKLLDFQEQSGETSDIIVKYLTKVLNEYNLNTKIVAFCGDNANCNFGGYQRRGSNNVFSKLKSTLNPSLIGIGCGAHIVHNAVKSAADCLPFDVEVVIVKIYSFFYIYTVRVETLKDFCADADIGYQKLLGYSKTRWLALMPAVERVLKMYEALKSYFLSIEKCPTILKSFFENPSSELWLYFIHAQASTFHQVILKIEGQKISAIEVAKEINKLKQNLILKQNTQFLPLTVRKLMAQLHQNGFLEEEFVKTTATIFYKTCHEYLSQWTSYYEDLHHFEWVNLTTVPTWENIQKAIDILTESGFIQHEKDTEIFDEFSLITNYVTLEKISGWNNLNVAVENRWVELFNHFKNNNLNHSNFSTIIEYALCLPGTNSSTERTFSLMNKIWTVEKSQLQVAVLKAMIILKVNVNKTCQEFYTYLKSSPSLLKQICSSEKYTKPEVAD